MKIIGAFNTEEAQMTWSIPLVVEICVGMEVNAYAPADPIDPEF